MSKCQQVLLAIDYRLPGPAAVMRRILNYGAWSVETKLFVVLPEKKALQTQINRSFDLVVTSEADPEWLRSALTAPAPILQLMCTGVSNQDFCVGLDPHALTELVLGHVLTAGYQNFGYLTRSGEGTWEQMETAAARLGIRAFRAPSLPESAQQLGLHADEAAWLHSLPKPCAIFTPHPEDCTDLVQLAQQSGIDIPNQVGLICLDTGGHLLDTFISLTRVKIPLEQIGLETARLADRLLAHPGSRPPHEIRIAPRRIAVRHSTHAIRFEDKTLTHAMCFIRDHALTPISVQDVCKHVNLSHTALSTRMKRIMQSTPLQEIRKVRIEHAKTLLLDSTMSIPDIARTCGFSGPEYFTTAFKQLTGGTPGKLRRKTS